MPKFIAGVLVGFLVSTLLGFRATVYHRFPELDEIDDLDDDEFLMGNLDSGFVAFVGNPLAHDDSGLPGRNHNHN